MRKSASSSASFSSCDSSERCTAFAVALAAGAVARATVLKEDASLAAFYLISLALGVTIVSLRGSAIDLLHVLFGNILAMDDQTLLVIAFNATITLVLLAVIYRPLVIECVDPVFLRTVSRAGAPAHLTFLALVVVNLVNGFHALGYDLGNFVADAVKRASEKTGVGVQQAMAATKGFVGVTGTFDIDEHHNPVKSIVVIGLKDGVQATSEKIG